MRSRVALDAPFVGHGSKQEARGSEGSSQVLYIRPQALEKHICSTASISAVLIWMVDDQMLPYVSRKPSLIADGCKLKLWSHQEAIKGSASNRMDI